MKVGILGAGHIAHKMANTLRNTPYGRYAVAARDLSRAQAFADQWGFSRAYGSYEELVSDPAVDLIYIATPHSHHFAHGMLALGHGKAVLMEKAFTCNAREAETLIRTAREKGIFIAEAIWTRYMPFSATIRETLDSGIIGTPRFLSANLSYPIEHKERLVRPELGGGALLDIGVYAINFARMCFGTDITRIDSSCQLWPTGMDMQETITLHYTDGRMASLWSSAVSASERSGIIAGTKGYMVVENINNPLRATIWSEDHQFIQTLEAPPQITGFEYEVEACAEALRNGWVESPYMPHNETIAVMKLMDTLRAQWGVRFPNDDL